MLDMPPYSRRPKRKTVERLNESNLLVLFLFILPSLPFTFPFHLPSNQPATTMSQQTNQKQQPIELDPAAQATFDLITRNLDEVLLPEIIKEKLVKGEVVKCYWGTAPTGRRESPRVFFSFLDLGCGVNSYCRCAWLVAHLGYFVPLTKIADFLKAGVAVTVLLAGTFPLSYTSWSMYTDPIS